MFRDKKVIMIATIVILIIGLVSIGTFSLMMVNKANNKTTTTKKVESSLMVKNISNVANAFTLELSEVEEATKYNYLVTDEEGNTLINGEFESNKGEFSIPLESLSNNKKLYLKCDAIKDDKGVQMES